MLPIINIFGREFMTYTLCAAIGILVSGYYVCRQAKKRGHNDNDYIVFLLVSAIGVFTGGHILYAITQYRVVFELITNWGKYVTSFNSFLDCMGIIFSGSVFYGGLLGGMLAGFVYGKIRKLDLKEVSDICAPMAPLFHCFGRIGCFLSGCCYGIESSFGYTVHNNHLIPGLNGVNRFPVQLLEATLNLLLFLLLAHLLNKDTFKGKLFALYLLIYSVIRFSDEFLRGDIYRGIYFGLSTSQIISIILFISSAIYLIVQHRKIKKQIQ